MSTVTRNRMAANFSAVITSLRKESDRGSVIVAGAWIEDQLSEVLNKFFVNSLVENKKNDELFGTRGYLGSFAAKIDIAYRAALITVEVRRSLHLCRRLRNDFAHLANPISFKTPSIIDRVRVVFELNRDILESIWRSTEAVMPDDIRKEVDEVGASEALEQALGIRPLFELTAGTVVAGLTFALDHVEPLPPLERL